MDAAQSVTRWFLALGEGDQDAAQQLWQRYAARLVGLARKRLSNAPRMPDDEEDVALSAFHSFCRGAGAGRFTRLEDREDLWQLLVTITVRKAADRVNHELRQKRGGGKVVGESAFLDAGPQSQELFLQQLVGTEPTPDLAAMMTEQCEHLLQQLDDEQLRTIALLKMEGYSNQEVAERLGCARCTVQRRLNLIRGLWEQELA